MIASGCGPSLQAGALSSVLQPVTVASDCDPSSQAAA